MDEQQQDYASCIIKNFRPVVGTRNLYRCANPDGLADRLLDTTGDDEDEARPRLHPNEDLVLNRAGLIIDLRSDSERDSGKCRAWLDNAPGGAFRVVYDVAEIAAATTPSPPPSLPAASSPRPQQLRRTVLRLDPLHPDLLMSYLEENWMTNGERWRALWYKLVDGQALHNLRLDVLNRNGLAGLNRAVLVTGGPSLVQGLKAIVLHLERSVADSSASFPSSPVVIHCVQGKDRTGMLSMLCQLVAGIDKDDNEAIAADYHRSEAHLAPGAAAVAQAYPGRIDKRFFTGAPRRVMVETLDWIRSRYGGVDGYLDEMGFGPDWRSRLAAVLAPSQDGSNSSITESSTDRAAPALSRL
jgi:hypothetical protein